MYPGDDYVDIIGVDGYNFGDYAGHRWTEPADLFGPTLDLMTKSRRGKPCGLTRLVAVTAGATRRPGSRTS